MVKFEEGIKSWVAFRYERLPNFCYWCGCLDHGEKDCDVGLKQRQASEKQEYQFGAWLRATSDRPPHKIVVSVLGNQPKCRGKTNRNDSPKHQPATETEELTRNQRANGKNSENTVEDPESEMEVESNSDLPIQDTVQKSNAATFNDQLKEIDQAINYIPSGENTTAEDSVLSYVNNFQTEHGPKLVGPQVQPMHCFSNPTRRPLQDISNGQRNMQKQKSSTTKWKKLARAHKPTSDPPTIVQPLKRDFMIIEEDHVQGKRLRTDFDQCTFGNPVTIEDSLECRAMMISAAAGSQPCRKP